MLNDINYKGKKIDISDIGKLDVNNEANYLYNYGNIDIISASSRQHFAKLDEFIGGKE